MYRRGLPGNQDKLFSCCFYLIPLIEVLPLGFYIYSLFPILYLFLAPLVPFLAIYHLNIGGIAIIQWGIFLALYAGVVRSYKFSNFVRYNGMQSLLLSIFAALCSAGMQLFGLSSDLLGGGGSNFFLFNILFTLIFLFVIASCFYSIFQCLRGFNAEIPIISDAAYSQIR